MPEGDSIHRLAARLQPVLVGREVTSFVARRISDADTHSLVGHRITSVTARGKNLLVRFDDERVLHVHLKMDGRIFVERPRSAFYLPATTRGTPEMRLAVSGGKAIVGRDLPVCRLLTATQEKRDANLGGLGPDLLAPTWDEAEVLRRARRLQSFPRHHATGALAWEIADALLVQRVAAGIGNVYKSEVLFIEGVHPKALLKTLDDDTILRLYRTSSVLLKRNVGNGPRTTRPTLGAQIKWVYGRADKPCLKCETPIVYFMQGPEGGRSTYYCPKCQVAAASRVSASTA